MKLWKSMVNTLILVKTLQIGSSLLINLQKNPLMVFPEGSKLYAGFQFLCREMIRYGQKGRDTELLSREE